MKTAVLISAITVCLIILLSFNIIELNSIFNLQQRVNTLEANSPTTSGDGTSPYPEIIKLSNSSEFLELSEKNYTDSPSWKNLTSFTWVPKNRNTNGILSMSCYLQYFSNDTNMTSLPFSLAWNVFVYDSESNKFDYGAAIESMDGGSANPYGVPPEQNQWYWTPFFSMVTTPNLKMNQISYNFLVKIVTPNGYYVGENGTIYYYRSGYIRNMTILLEVID